MGNRNDNTRTLSRRALLLGPPLAVVVGAAQRTEVAIVGDAFDVNGRPTYEGRRYEGARIEGLLMNSRVVQGIFDDANEATVSRWAYPDTGKWDPDRNTDEFVAAMELRRACGVLSFTINLQGGSPQGYSKVQPRRNSAFRANGSLKPEYMARLKKILDRADELGMAPIVGYFYSGQDQHLEGDAAVTRAVDEATR
jgi:hypothetical protein